MKRLPPQPTILLLRLCWGTGDAPRYTNEELITYIQSVNSHGGIVTLDTSVTGGSIEPTHLAQLAAVKTTIRG